MHFLWWPLGSGIAVAAIYGLRHGAFDLFGLQLSVGVGVVLGPTLEGLLRWPGQTPQTPSGAGGSWPTWELRLRMGERRWLVALALLPFALFYGSQGQSAPGALAVVLLLLLPGLLLAAMSHLSALVWRARQPLNTAVFWWTPSRLLWWVALLWLWALAVPMLLFASERLGASNRLAINEPAAIALEVRWREDFGEAPPRWEHLYSQRGHRSLTGDFTDFAVYRLPEGWTPPATWRVSTVAERALASALADAWHTAQQHDANLSANPPWPVAQWLARPSPATAVRPSFGEIEMPSAATPRYRIWWWNAEGRVLLYAASRG